MVGKQRVRASSRRLKAEGAARVGNTLALAAQLCSQRTLLRQRQRGRTQQHQDHTPPHSRLLQENCYYFFPRLLLLFFVLAWERRFRDGRAAAGSSPFLDLREGFTRCARASSWAR